MKILQLLIGCLLLSNVAVPAVALSSVCLDADSSLAENEDLVSIFTEMTTRFELNKTIAPQEVPVDLTIRQDYSGLIGRNYDRIKNICENDFGYDLCHVISWTYRTETVANIQRLPIDSIPVKRETIEILKPVCFPQSCSEDQVNILDPFPADCDPLISDCEIKGYSVQCPSKKTTLEDTSTCADDVIPNGNRIYPRLNVLAATMQTNCATLFAGGKSIYCSVDYGTFSVDTLTDFSTGRELVEQYDPYETTCLQNGGQICDADITATYIVQNGDVGEIMLSEDYLQIPLCLPPVCADEGDSEDVAAEAFRRYTFDSRVVSNCGDNCDVMIHSVTCKEVTEDIPIPPTASPTTSQPTVLVITESPTADSVSSTCREAKNLLAEDENLKTNFFAMMGPFESNKTWTPQTDPVDVFASYNYSGSSGWNFDKIRDICEVDFGYSLCEVTAITTHEDSFDNIPFLPIEINIPISRKVTEIAKPVCFPPTCSAEQVDILDPNPANCDTINPDAGCEVLSYDVTCPAREESTNTTSCAIDAIQPGNPIFPRLNVLEASIVSSCASFVPGVGGNTCEIEYGSFEVDAMTDFVTNRDKVAEFDTFEASCFEAGGKVCDTDLTAAYDLTTENFIDLVLTENFMQLPLCLPQECSGEEDETNAAILGFREYTRDSFTLPDCETDVCDVLIYSVSCYGP